jgi:hypothetical protein
VSTGTNIISFCAPNPGEYIYFGIAIPEAISACVASLNPSGIIKLNVVPETLFK